MKTILVIVSLLAIFEGARAGQCACGDARTEQGLCQMYEVSGGEFLEFDGPGHRAVSGQATCSAAACQQLFGDILERDIRCGKVLGFVRQVAPGRLGLVESPEQLGLPELTSASDVSYLGLVGVESQSFLSCADARRRCKSELWATQGAHGLPATQSLCQRRTEQVAMGELLFLPVATDAKPEPTGTCARVKDPATGVAKFQVSCRAQVGCLRDGSVKTAFYQ